MTETQNPVFKTPAAKSTDATDDWLKSQFLTEEDGSAGTGLSMRNYINFRRYETPDIAWFMDEQIDWALEAVRSDCKITSTSDTVIATTYMSELLYKMSAGVVEADPDPVAVAPVDRLPLQERYPHEYNALVDKRYVFLPVNNAMKTEMDNESCCHKQKRGKEEKRKEPEFEAEAQQGKETPENVIMIDSTEEELTSSVSTNEDEEEVTNEPAPKEQTPKVDSEEVTKGVHWSFIIIDTTLNTARYLDGLVRVEKGSKKKHRILNTEWNAPVAGKILCGFDIFMQRTKGKFVASTLKWTPHQFNDNRTKGDSGSCGPHIYAMVKYILKNRSRILDRTGVKRYFNQAQKSARCREINFNSVDHRDQIRDQLWLLRQQKEKASAGIVAAVPPGNLTPENLTKILRPNVLAELLTPGILQRLLEIRESLDTEQKHTSTSPIESPQLSESEWGKRYKFALEFKFTTLDDLTLDEFRKYVWNDEILKDELRWAYNETNGLPSDGPGPGNQDGPESQGDEGPGNQDDPEPRGDKGPGDKETPTQGFYDTTNTGNLVIPDGLAMPKDFADNNEVDKAALGQWKEVNKEVLEELILENGKENEISYRAALHASSGRGFDRESNDRLSNLWRNDSYAVTPLAKEDLSQEAIRLYMKKTYERTTAGGPTLDPSMPGEKRKRREAESKGGAIKKSKAKQGGSGSQSRKH